MRYVERIVAALPARTPSARATRSSTSRASAAGVIVRTADGARDTFDAVVMATHADDALALLDDADPASGARSAASSTRRTGSCSTPTSGCCPVDRRRAASWNVDQADCRRPGRPADDDLPHEPAAVAARPGPVLRLGQPRRPAATRRGSSPSGRCSHPIYTFRTLEAQAAVAQLQGRRRTWFAGAHLGYGFHEDGCRSGFEAAAGIASAAGRGAGGMRSHLLEGVVRHRRARPFTYELEHDVFYVALDLDELDEVDRCAPACSAATARSPCRFRDERPPRPAGGRPPRRRSSITCAPRGGPGRLADHARDEPAGRSATSSTRPASSSAATRTATLRVVVVEVHNTHGERHLYTLRPARRRRTRSWPRWTRRSTSRRSSRCAAATTVRVRDEPARLRITINERPGRGPRCSTPAWTSPGGR